MILYSLNNLEIKYPTSADINHKKKENHIGSLFYAFTLLLLASAGKALCIKSGLNGSLSVTIS